MLELLLIVVGFIVGAIGTLVGAGGGFLLVPVLLFLYPDDPPELVTTISLAVVFINGVSGSLAYARLGRVDYRTGVLLAAATVPGSVLGAVIVGYIARGPFTVIFALVMISVAVLLFNRPSPKERLVTVEARGLARRTLVDRLGQTYTYAFPVIPAFLISLGIGLLSSLLGIGGGIVQVPVFIMFLGFPTYIATATSSFMLVVTSLSGTITHVLAGDFADAWLRTLVITPGVIAGSQFGAWLSRRTRPRVIARVLAVTMVLAAGRLLWAQLL